jgi:hypothetical protein
MNIILKTQFMKKIIYFLFPFFSFFLSLSFFPSFFLFFPSLYLSSTTRHERYLISLSLYRSVSDGRRSRAGTAWRRGSRSRERRGPAVEERRCGPGSGRWAVAAGGGTGDAGRCARLRRPVATAARFLLCA